MREYLFKLLFQSKFRELDGCRCITKDRFIEIQKQINEIQKLKKDLKK